MDQSNLQRIIDLYNKKVKLFARLSAVIMILLLLIAIALSSFGLLAAVIFLFIPLNYFITVAVVARWQARYLMPILTEKLDAQAYYTARRATNSLDRFAVQDISVAYYLGDDAAVVDLCNQMLNEPKARRFRYYYLAMLANVRLRHHEMEELRVLCDRFEREVTADKKQARIRRTFPIFEYCRMYLNGDIEGCQRYAQQHYSPKPTSTPLDLVHFDFSNAVYLYRVGKHDEARPLFASVKERAPLLFYSTYAQRYLAAMDEDVDYVPLPISTADHVPTKPTVSIQSTKKMRRTVIAAFLCGIILLTAGVALLWEDRPAKPYDAIQREDVITELIATVPLDESGDCLAIYLSSHQNLDVAYLKSNGKGQYTFGLQKESISMQMLYSFGIAKRDIRVSFALYEQKSDIPANAISVTPITVNDTPLYFAVLSVEQEDLRFNSIRTLIKP